MIKKKSHIHFVGIGGIGMSGIATLLHEQGHIISGCDTDLEQKSIQQLKAIGCTIYQGNNHPECSNTSITTMVYTTMVTNQAMEILNASQRGIPVISRGQMLSILLEKYLIRLCVAGSHGKTTTSALIAHILLKALYNPTIIIGGYLKNLNSNVRIGSKAIAVVESDESDRSFLFLKPTIAVITNISLEHLETYTDIEDIKKTFLNFINNVTPDGKIIIGIDDLHLASLHPQLKGIVHTYGLSTKADLYAAQIKQEAEKTSFSVYQKTNSHSTPLCHIDLPLLGIHNVQNALAAFLTTLHMNVPLPIIIEALETFKGVERRFIYHGLYKNAEIFDDYGHHPREISATIIAATYRVKNKLIVIFQPHRYTRLAKLWHHFIDAFLPLAIDLLIITDVHAAGEQPIQDITGKNFYTELMNRQPAYSVLFAPLSNNFLEIKELLDAAIEPNDLILIVGAGKVNLLTKQLFTSINN